MAGAEALPGRLSWKPSETPLDRLTGAGHTGRGRSSTIGAVQSLSVEKRRALCSWPWHLPKTGDQPCLSCTSRSQATSIRQYPVIPTRGHAPFPRLGTHVSTFMVGKISDRGWLYCLETCALSCPVWQEGPREKDRPSDQTKTSLISLTWSSQNGRCARSNAWCHGCVLCAKLSCVIWLCIPHFAPDTDSVVCVCSQDWAARWRQAVCHRIVVSTRQAFGQSGFTKRGNYTPFFV
jgi:hypothetical protein